MWQLRPDAKHAKPRKAPIDARSGREAKVDTAATWSTYDDAAAALKRGPYSGVGFVLAADDPFCGIDLDGCIDEAGAMQPWAQAIVQRFNTYTEISQSGRGVKLLFRATKPPGSPCKGRVGGPLAKLECYDRGRYFALTGVRWANTPRDVAGRQPELDALLEELRVSSTAPSTRANSTSVHPQPRNAPGSRSWRTRTPSSASLLTRAGRYLAKMEPSIAGSRGHDRAYAAATAMVHGFGLEPDAAFELLQREFNPRCQPPWSERELRHKVNQAATKPHSHPHGWLLNSEPTMIKRQPERGGTRSASSRSSSPHATIAIDTGGADLRPPDIGSPANGGDGSPLARTDTGNAERFALQWKNDLRFCHPLGVWFRWDDRRWKEDDAGTPLRLAMQTARGIQSEALSRQGADRAELVKWGIMSESRKHLDAMVALAKSMPDLIVLPSQLDVHPWKLNVLNGTIDLRSGRLQPHSRDDLITLLAPVEYDQDALCPRFDHFLQRVLPDPSVAEFVLRFLGHALTGNVSEQILPIFHGTGANGKSVLVDTVTAMMGGYAGQAPPALLVVTNREEHPTELADLRAKRLVVASETEHGASLKMQLVKRLTGDQNIKARKMRENFIEFCRTHKMVLVTNNAPRIKENSEAIWRRIRMVEFGVVIPEAERDPGLLTALQSEWSGILARLVRACVDWQEQGIGSPAPVNASTTAYRENEDVVGRFLAEACSVDLGAPEAERQETAWKILYAAYRNWSEESGEPMSGGPSNVCHLS